MSNAPRAILKVETKHEIQARETKMLVSFSNTHTLVNKRGRFPYAVLTNDFVSVCVRACFRAVTTDLIQGRGEREQHYFVLTDK